MAYAQLKHFPFGKNLHNLFARIPRLQFFLLLIYFHQSALGQCVCAINLTLADVQEQLI